MQGAIRALFDTFSLPEDIREEMLALYHDPSSPEPQTKSSQESTALEVVPELMATDPRVCLATVDDFKEAILFAGRATNMAPMPDAFDHMARVMTLAMPQWTVGELQLAAALIPNDIDLSKQCSYNGSVTPAVFAAARSHKSVAKGRTHTYRQALASGAPISSARLGDKVVFIIDEDDAS